MYHERLYPCLEPVHFWLPGHIAGLELSIIAGVTPDCLFSRSFAVSFRPGFPERFASIMHFELVRMPEFVLSCSCFQTQDCTPTTIRFVQSIIDVDHWAAHTHTQNQNITRSGTTWDWHGKVHVPIQVLATILRCRLLLSIATEYQFTRLSSPRHGQQAGEFAALRAFEGISSISPSAEQCLAWRAGDLQERLCKQDEHPDSVFFVIVPAQSCLEKPMGSVYVIGCLFSLPFKKTLGIFWGIVAFYMDMLVCHLKMRSAHVSSLGCITAIFWMLQGLYWNGFLRQKLIQIMDWLRQHERRNFTGGSPGGRSKCHFSSKGCCRDSDSLPLKVLRSGRMGKLYGCPVHKMCSSSST